MKKWQLYSPCFRKGGPTITVKAQDPGDPMFEPHWNMNPGQNYIEFKHEVDHQFTDGLTRTYYITVHTGDYYAGIGTGNVDYLLHWPPGTNIEGDIMGPICAPDFVIPETTLGTIGSLIPLIIAAVLVAASKKNLISIKVT